MNQCNYSFDWIFDESVFLQFIIIYKDTKTIGKYYKNQVAWIENQSDQSDGRSPGEPIN